MNIPLGTSLGLLRGHWGMGSPVSIEADRHTAIVGATGTGKSTLLLNIIKAHIDAGHGLTVIDPHGDLAERAASLVPPERMRDAIWFDPLSSRVVGLNPLGGENKLLRLEQTIRIVATIWGEDAWGPQSDFIARNVGLAVMEVVPKPTLLHILKFFYSDEYGKWLFSRVRSSNLKSFYAKYREDWDKRQREMAAAPPTNKLDSFLKPAIKLVVGQEKGLDVKAMMDGSKLLFCRFDKGRLGPDAGAFLSSILVSMILFAGLERSGQMLRPYHAVVIDEFHNFTRGNAPDHLLAETRKYDVFLTVADQLSYGKAVYGNVGNLVAGRTGAEDAEKLALEFGLERPAFLIELPNRHWLLRKSGAGVVHFEGNPPPKPAGSPRALISRSLENHGVFRMAMERKINAFLAERERG